MKKGKFSLRRKDFPNVVMLTSDIGDTALLQSINLSGVTLFCCYWARGIIIYVYLNVGQKMCSTCFIYPVVKGQNSGKEKCPKKASKTSAKAYCI